MPASFFIRCQNHHLDGYVTLYDMKNFQ